jgi:hypothetical protein
MKRSDRRVGLYWKIMLAVMLIAGAIVIGYGTYELVIHLDRIP